MRSGVASLNLKSCKLFKSIIDNFGGNLQEIVCGGAPIRAEVGKFFDDIGIILFNGYGITECSPLVSVNRVECNDPSTVGMVLPCLEIKLEDKDEDGIGEICVKGDVVMKGYYKQPELTAEVLSEDGWFKTGDFGYMNKAGLLVATTPFDELNMLCCLIARKLGCEKTISRVRNPEYYNQIDLIKDDLGLSLHINPERAAANEISRLLRFPTALGVETFAKGRVEIMKYEILLLQVVELHYIQLNLFETL